MLTALIMVVIATVALVLILLAVVAVAIRRNRVTWSSTTWRLA